MLEYKTKVCDRSKHQVQNHNFLSLAWNDQTYFLVLSFCCTHALCPRSPSALSCHLLLKSLVLWLDTLRQICTTVICSRARSLWVCPVLTGTMFCYFYSSEKSLILRYKAEGETVASTNWMFRHICANRIFSCMFKSHVLVSLIGDAFQASKRKESIRGGRDLIVEALRHKVSFTCVSVYDVMSAMSEIKICYYLHVPNWKSDIF